MGSTFKSSGKTRMGGVRHCTIRTDRATAPRKIRMVLGAMIRENAAHFKKEKSHETQILYHDGHDSEHSLLSQGGTSPLSSQMTYLTYRLHIFMKIVPI